MQCSAVQANIHMKLPVASQLTVNASCEDNLLLTALMSTHTLCHHHTNHDAPLLLSKRYGMMGPNGSELIWISMPFLTSDLGANTHVSTYWWGCPETVAQQSCGAAFNQTPTIDYAKKTVRRHTLISRIASLSLSLLFFEIPPPTTQPYSSTKSLHQHLHHIPPPNDLFIGQMLLVIKSSKSRHSAY